MDRVIKFWNKMSKTYDVSDNMIALAKQKAMEKHIENVELRNIGIFDPGLQAGSFDVILAFNIFQFIKDENALLETKLLYEKPVNYFIAAKKREK
jgi:2-polyprenyl-3-methyl-5-hydroxy-6-metoxy-1,4-benzoquinol methylase